MEDTLEELSGVFDQAYSNMQRKENDNQYEANKELESFFDDLQGGLIGQLEDYISSDQILGNIADILTELKLTMRNLSNGKTDELVSRAIQTVKVAQTAIEEERSTKNVSKEEREEEENKQFGTVGQTLDRDYEEAKNDSNYDIIENSVEEAKSNVFGNIRDYIQFGDASRLISEFDDIKDEIDKTFGQATDSLQEFYSEDLKSVQEIITGEVEQVKEYAEEQLNERYQEQLKDKTEELSQAAKKAQFRDLFEKDTKPWELTNYGTTREEVNAKIAKATEETIASQNRDDGSKLKPSGDRTME